MPKKLQHQWVEVHAGHNSLAQEHRVRSKPLHTAVTVVDCSKFIVFLQELFISRMAAFVDFVNSSAGKK